MADLPSFQWFQGKHGRARDQGFVDLKIGVFSCRTDQDQGAVLDGWQQGILLGFVETMDFIDKKHRLARGGEQRILAVRNDALDVRHTGGHGIEHDKTGLGGLCDHPGQRCFTSSWRTKQDDRTKAVRLDHPAQHFALAQDVLLANIL